MTTEKEGGGSVPEAGRGVECWSVVAARKLFYCPRGRLRLVAIQWDCLEKTILRELAMRVFFFPDC